MKDMIGRHSLPDSHSNLSVETGAVHSATPPGACHRGLTVPQTLR